MQPLPPPFGSNAPTLLLRLLLIGLLLLRIIFSLAVALLLVLRVTLLVLLIALLVVVTQLAHAVLALLGLLTLTHFTRSSEQRFVERLILVRALEQLAHLQEVLVRLAGVAITQRIDAIFDVLLGDGGAGLLLQLLHVTHARSLAATQFASLLGAVASLHVGCAARAAPLRCHAVRWRLSCAPRIRSAHARAVAWTAVAWRAVAAKVALASASLIATCRRMSWMCCKQRNETYLQQRWALSFVTLNCNLLACRQ
jgi:hypothetical protein